MKTSLYTCAMVLSAASLLACGDDSSGTGGGGTGGDATTTGTTSATTATATTGPGTTTSATTGVTTTATGTGGATSSSSTNSGGGGSGAGDCTAVALTDLGLDGGDGSFLVFAGSIDPTLADGDISRLEFYDPPIGTDGATPGTYDLAAAGDDNYATCSRCVLVISDVAAKVPTFYFQRGGEMTVDAIDLATGIASVSLDGVTLHEVTIGDGAVSTPVPGGACLRITDADLDLAPPSICDSGITGGDEATDVCIEADPNACDAFESCTDTGADIDSCIACIQAGGGPLCDAALQVIYDSNCFTPDTWTCAAEDYWDGAGCECICGAADPDCNFDTNPVTGCAVGEACGGDVCYPAGWECTPAYYDAGDGCDCNCGIYDPDCDDGADDPFGCAVGQSCDLNGDCVGVPDAWACLDAAYDDGVTCDCACGAVDPDCEDSLIIVGCNLGEICSAGICLPEDWICAGGFYGTDDGCDCGCGIIDPDCADANDTSCEYCVTPSCGDAGDGTCDLALLVDDDNAVCN